MKIYNNILETIGSTPLVRLNSIASCEADVLAKVEYFNPSGSIKDRAAYSMMNEAIKRGEIIPNQTVIIEPTSGNTGIGLAMTCAVLGFELILTMPETMSKERRDLLKAYGAKLVLTEGSKGMQGAVDKALELQKEIKNSFIPQQFSNSDNPKAHYEKTALEIWNDTDGKVDIVVAGVGTGGTISGIAKKLKELNPAIKAIALEPSTSALISTGVAGAHKIQGIGANFIPKNFDKEVIDEVITVTNEEAIEFTRKLAKSEGIFAGISSGAAVAGAFKIANDAENKGKLIVAILPDSGARYLSNPVFSDEE